MTTDRFDRIVRVLTLRLGRREAVAATLATAGTSGPMTARAGTCRPFGSTCKRSRQCCSGLCKGRKKMTCRAHDTGGCQPGEGDCDILVTCTTSEGLEGRCYTTTGDAGFCGFTGDCMVCQRDADCQAVYGPRTACIADCFFCPDTGGSACVTAGEITHPMG